MPRTRTDLGCHGAGCAMAKATGRAPDHGLSSSIAPKRFTIWDLSLVLSRNGLLASASFVLGIILRETVCDVCGVKTRSSTLRLRVKEVRARGARARGGHYLGRTP